MPSKTPLYFREVKVSLFVYDGNQETPPNYIGCRIVVSINNKIKQKWFNGTGHEKEAKELHDQWKMEQRLAQWARNRERKSRPTRTPYITQVCGIKMKFQGNGKRGKAKCFFIVSGSVNKKRFIKHFKIKKLGFDMAWFKACEYCAKQYSITKFDHLLKRKPDPRQFFIIMKWQKKQGMNITFDQLPDEILKAETV